MLSLYLQLHRPAVILLGLLSALCISSPQAAHAETACEPVHPQALAARQVQLRQAIVDDDLEQFDEAKAWLRAQAPCLTGVVDTSVWARWLVDHAIVAFVRKEDWQSALSTALSADPLVDRVVGHFHPIYSFQTPSQLGVTKALPPGAKVYLDGREIGSLPPLVGPHLLQVVDDVGVRSVYLHDERLPADFLPGGPEIPTDPIRRSRRPMSPAGRWVLVGASVAALGAASGTTAWALRKDTITRADAQGLRAANIVGWSGAVVGVGLGTAGFLQTRRVQGPAGSTAVAASAAQPGGE